MKSIVREDGLGVGRSAWFESLVPWSLGVALVLLVTLYALFPEIRIPLWHALLGGALIIPIAVMSDGMIRSHPFVERALILGRSPIGSKLIEEIQSQPRCRYAIVGVADDGIGVDERSAQCLGSGPLQHSDAAAIESLEHIARTIEEVHPDRIVVALPERRGRLPVNVLVESRARGIVVEDALEMYERITRKVAIESLNPSLLLFSRAFRKSPLELGLRRLLSFGVTAVGLLMTAPLMALIAVAIRIDSPGPVLFQQERVGQGGRLFRLFKFRTMYHEVASTYVSVWHRDDSTRITRVGRWLRRTRLDEIPQFWNVLQGDMDLVGPRPEMACNVQTMTEEIPYYFLRHSRRPGITGWAQIKHHYSMSLEDVTEKMRYDLYYLKHLSLWFDLRIIVHTIKIVLVGRGSA